MTKGLWVYCPSPMFSKTFIFQYFYILSDLFSFWNNFPPPRHLPLFVCVFFKSPFPQPCFHKYTDLICNLKLSLLNIRAVPSSAVFCNNCFSVFLFSVLITTPSSSMHFFSFLDVLSRAPTTTGMSLMLLMFHTLLISLFSSWYLNFFLLFFTNSYVYRYSNINYGTTSLTLIHYNNIWFSWLDLSITLDHNIPQNLHFFIFNNTLRSMFIPFFTSYQVLFPTKFPMNYPCNVIVASPVLLLCQLLC